MFDWIDAVLVALALLVLGTCFVFLRRLTVPEITDTRKFITSARQRTADGREGPEVKFDRPVSIYQALMATKPPD
jgi:hypothetical protein